MLKSLSKAEMEGVPTQPWGEFPETTLNIRVYLRDQIWEKKNIFKKLFALVWYQFLI